MINFTILTDTPARLRNFLINRGVMELVTDPISGEQNLVGARPGMEFVEVPNPIITSPAGGEPRLPDGTPNPDYVPAVHDTRRVFMVKFAHESEGEKAQGFHDWVTNNAAPVTAPANYTISGEPVGDAWKVNGENVWLIRDNPERFGVWQ